jgi:hypothetical protein
MADKTKNIQNKNVNGFPMGVGVGVALGAGIGAALGNIAIGAGIGVALGAAFDTVNKKRQKKKDD